MDPPSPFTEVTKTMTPRQAPSWLVALVVLCSPASMSAQQPTVAIVGTGDVANSIGPKLAAGGYAIVYGSRDPNRESVVDLVELTGSGAYATTQREAAAAADIIVLAVPWQAMQQVVANLGDVSGKALVDVSDPNTIASDGYMESSVETSASELIQGWQPDAYVVKMAIPSSYLIDEPTFLGPPPTVMLASDHRASKEAVGEIVAELGLDPWDAGPLRMARAIEAFRLLFWVPLLQGRDEGIEFRLMRSSYWPCFWDVQATFGAPPDVDDLAQLPGESEPRPCESFPSGR
jgi:8-hydroxy-5-deazaflavin:NADPH oxidoreductase